MSVPFVYDNPYTSLLWKVLAFEHLARRRGVRFVRTGFCQSGTAWRKSTGLMCGYCNISYVANQCTGYCVCSRSGHPHKQLSGVDLESQLFWTHIAELYPRGLCTAIVRMITDALQQLKHQRVGKLLEYLP